MIRPLLLAAALLAAPAAHARDVTEADREAIDARIAELDGYMEAGDMGAVSEVVPPAIFETMAAELDLSVDELLAAMTQAMEQMMTQVEIVSFEMRPEGVEGRDTASGRPYLLVPTETVMRAEGQTLRNESITVAMEEGGEWFLVRVDDMNQIAMLRKAFPDFEGVEFPRGRMSVVE